VVACIIVVLLFLRPVLAVFPVAALGAIVIYAATRLVDLAEFRRLARYRRSELVLSLVTLLSVLVFDILKGIVVAVLISGAETLRRIARPNDAVQGHVEGVAGMHDIDDYPDATMTPGLLVYRYDAPLYFANARDFRKRALAAADAHAAGLHWFVLNVEANVDIDITAMDAVEEVRAKLADRGVVFAFARVKHDILGPLQTYGLVDRVGADRLFPTLPTAEAAYRAWEREQADALHRPPPADAQPDTRADTPAGD
jgi:MFS superfamily sulfate permease-like transporter